MKRFISFTPEEIKAIRQKFHLSQSQFAKKLKVALASVAAWEKGRHLPWEHPLLKRLQKLQKAPAPTAPVKQCGFCQKVLTGHYNRRYCNVACRNQQKVERVGRDVINKTHREKYSLKAALKSKAVLPPETPVVYYNYKEPLKAYEGGFGFAGVLAGNESGTHVQCHICGYLFKFLPSHIKSKHGINAEQYKDKVGLMQKTALVSEKFREAQIKWHRDPLNWDWRKKSAENITRFNREVDSGTKTVGKKQYRAWTLEKRNLTGTCPDQLLEKIKEAAVTLGHTPSAGEFRAMHTRYCTTILTTFGSWKRAVRLAGMLSKHDERDEKHQPGLLLEYLKNFYQQRGRNATRSDFERGLLPSYQIYLNAFGSINTAREMAGLPKLIRKGWYQYDEER